MTGDRWTCCRTIDDPLYSDTWELPVVFHMLAHISPYQCFLTRRGDGPYLGQDGGGCMASCWLNPCESPQLRNNWRKMQRNLLTLRAHTPAQLHMPHFFRPSPSRYLWSMQVGSDYTPAEVLSSGLHFSLDTDALCPRRMTSYLFLTDMETERSLQPFPMSLSASRSKYSSQFITHVYRDSTIFIPISFDWIDAFEALLDL